MLAKVMIQRDKLIENSTTDDDLYFAANLPYVKWIQDATQIRAICASTERILWHQHLGHPSDYYLYTVHKFINGVPKFKHNDQLLEKCLACIILEHPKAAGIGNTMKATRPMQCWSVNVDFAGQTLKDAYQMHNYLGIHGEPCWILIKDHFSGYLISKCQKSNASPLT